MTIRPMDERLTPTMQLVGNNGDASIVRDAVRSAIHKAGWTPEEMVEVMDDMLTGGYNHSISVAMDVCEVS